MCMCLGEMLGEMLGYHCTGENQGKLVKINSEQEMTSQEMLLMNMYYTVI